MGLFSNSPKSCLGIDLGSTSVKIVELKKVHNQPRLISYGFSENKKNEKNDWRKDTSFTAEVIKQIIKKAGMSSKDVVSSLPTFSVFSSIINLANISKKDISSAVHWEAKKVIPLPLEEMILDWKLIEDQGDAKNAQNNTGGNIKVLLTGAPKELVKKYIEIYKKAGLNLLSLETETFALVRSLLGSDKSTVMIVEMGANTTDVTIVDNSIPLFNRSIDVGGVNITRDISANLGIGNERAEQFKYDLGVSSQGKDDEVIPKIIKETISQIINEMKYAMNLYENKNGKKTEKIILSGGSAMLPGLAGYISDVLDVHTMVGDPWSRISYPVDLKGLLDEIGSYMSISIGLAMREIK
jgi:type IV pilus assembly protein PilM